MFYRYLCVLGFLAALGMLGCGADGSIVARINSGSISLKEYERQLLILKSIRPETKLDEGTKRQLLEQMAKQELLTQEAKKAGLDLDPNVKAAMQSQHESVRKELETSILHARAQLDQLERAVEQKVLIERLLEARKGSIKVTDKELRRAYQSSHSQTPFKQVEGQLRQQLLLEKLVEQVRPGAKIELFPDVAARAETPKE